MLMRDPILWALGISALATVYVLLDRRSKSRLTLLDSFASEHGLAIEKDVGPADLAPFDPLALVAPVVGVERLMQGRLQIPGLSVDAWLAACLVGTGRRPRRYLIGLFASHPELPAMRVLPEGETDAPSELGFVPMPAAGMAPGYRVEAFQPLKRVVSTAVGEVLGGFGLGWRIELRPGRLILALPSPGNDAPDQMMTLAARLSHALHVALRPEDEAEPVPPAAGGAPPPLLN